MYASNAESMTSVQRETLSEFVREQSAAMDSRFVQSGRYRATKWRGNCPSILTAVDGSERPVAIIQHAV